MTDDHFDSGDDRRDSRGDCPLPTSGQYCQTDSVSVTVSAVGPLDIQDEVLLLSKSEAFRMLYFSALTL